MDDKQILEELQITLEDLNELKEHFSFKGLLGTGAYGQVLKAEFLKTQQLVAVKVNITAVLFLHRKIIKKNKLGEKEQKKFQKEAKILSHLNHMNIIKFIEVWIFCVCGVFKHF